MNAETAITPKRGRPKKRNEAYYQGIWESYCFMLKWYTSAYNGIEPESVPKLLVAYFSNSFVKIGMRSTRVNDPNFKGKLKTLRNDISIAKTLRRTNPKNWPF